VLAGGLDRCPGAVLHNPWARLQDCRGDIEEAHMAELRRCDTKWEPESLWGQTSQGRGCTAPIEDVTSRAN
jgi:hypothetical protein